MNNFVKRSLSGAVYIGLIIGTLLADFMFFIPLFALITAVCLWEFLHAGIKSGSQAKILGVIGGTLLYIISAYGLFGQTSLLSYLPFLLALPLIIILLGLFQPAERNFQDAAYLLLSFLYIVVPFVLLTSIQLFHRSGSGLSPLLAIFILFWTNDTGAYLFGRKFGKHALFPAVSPKKTWEGLIGGALLCLVAAYVLSLYALSFSLQQWMIIGTLVAVFGTLGDLVESMWKRQLGIKDSGNIMPGHGGLLDRFDGFFIALPAIHLYLFLLKF